MLPDVVVQVARRGTQLAIQERHAALDRQIGDVTNRFNARGVLRSGMFFREVHDLIAAEFKIRARLAWQNWARALATQGAVNLADVRSTVLAEIESSLRVDGAESSDLAGHYYNARMIANFLGNPPDTLDRLKRQAIDQIAGEIDFAILEAQKGQPAGSQTATFHIYAPVGVIQTGPGATASVQQAFNEPDHDIIRQALDAVSKALASSTDLAQTQRQALDEVIGDVRGEIEKTQPNRIRVQAGLMGIATAIQTLGSAAPAYALLKGALALFNVHLP